MKPVRTGTLIALAWFSATLLQALILAAQEGLFVLWGLINSAIDYGILASLGVALWRVHGRHQHRFAAWAPLVRACFYGALVIGLAAVWKALSLGISGVAFGTIVVEEQLGSGGLWVFLQALLISALVVMAIVYQQLAADLRRRREREAELVLAMRDAELRALRAQIRPHFLFNALNSITSLIRFDPQRAEMMVGMLGDLLRDTLEHANQTEIPLADEVRLAKRYLELEEIRFGERLQFSFDVPAALEDVAVPPFLLQPLVENVVHHAVSSTNEGCVVRVHVAERERVLEIRIEDNGPGLEQSWQEGNGLRITRSRLEKLYPDRAYVALANRNEGGCQATVTLPAQHAVA